MSALPPSSSSPSVLDEVAAGLSPLLRAVSLARRAAVEGFDWSQAQEVAPVVRSEVDELLVEVERGDPVRIEQEFGDLLLALSNLARHLEIDPHRALSDACDRFEARFRQVEEAVRGSDRTLREHSVEELDRFWEQAKARLAAAEEASCSRS